LTGKKKTQKEIKFLIDSKQIIEDREEDKV
jgi:hypothetical protein